MWKYNTYGATHSAEWRDRCSEEGAIPYIPAPVQYTIITLNYVRALGARHRTAQVEGPSSCVASEVKLIPESKCSPRSNETKIK